VGVGYGATFFLDRAEPERPITLKAAQDLRKKFQLQKAATINPHFRPRLAQVRKSCFLRGEFAAVCDFLPTVYRIADRRCSPILPACGRYTAFPTSPWRGWPIRFYF